MPNRFNAVPEADGEMTVSGLIVALLGRVVCVGRARWRDGGAR